MADIFRTEVLPSVRTSLPGTKAEADGPRRKVHGFTAAQRFDLVGALAAGVALATLLFGWFAPLSGAIGWTIVAFLAFLGLYMLLIWLHSDIEEVKDRLITTLFSAAGTLLFTALVFIVIYTLWRGMGRARPPEPVHPDHGVRRPAGRAGGRRHPARHRRHPDPDLDRAGDHHSAGDRHGRLPQRGRRKVRPLRPDHLRRHDGAALDRGRPVRLRRGDPGHHP